MKNAGTTIFFICCCSFLFSQTVIKGRVQNADSRQSIDYVNIGIIDKAKGTVSDENGSFVLELKEAGISENDTIRFSRIGYETVKFSLTDLKEKLNKSSSIYMKESLLNLNEVIISNLDTEKNRIGYSSSSGAIFGFWNDSLALGGEHATRIQVKKGPLKLEDLSFNVVHSISDSLLVRVNIYEIKKGLPSKNISNKNILYMIKKKNGRMIIDLSAFNIIVHDDFIVSLELLKIYGGSIEIAISALRSKGRSYYRTASQDKWKRARKGTIMAFDLNTSLIESDAKSTLASAKKNRDTPTELKILWDKSYSMVGKHLYKELKFLNSYFEYLGNVNVVFCPFGNTLQREERFSIENGNWGDLRKRITNIIYDGSNDIGVLNNLTVGENTLLFSDGNRFPLDINRDWTGTVFTVNSKSEANHNLLKALAEDSDANYINLHKIDDIPLAVRFMQIYMVDNSDYKPKGPDNGILREIRGNVSDFDDPLPDVLVTVRGTGRLTKTNAQGDFMIQAETGEILNFSVQGRPSTEMVVSAGNGRHNVTMPLDVQILDEVVLEKWRRTNGTKGLSVGKKKIYTNFGTLDPDKIGFSVKQVRNDQIGGIYRNITDAIRGRFAGVKVLGEGSNARVGLRGNEVLGIYATWDVDGLQYPPDNPPVHINIDDVSSITIMPGSWAAARYGSLAGGGIVIVRTVSQSFKTSGSSKPQKKDSGVMVQNNVYQGDAVYPEGKIGSFPKYVQQILNSQTADEGYRNYIKLRNGYQHLPHFFTDIHDLFIKKWNDTDKALLILSNIEEKFYGNVDALRLLAYKYDENGIYEKSLPVYKAIHDLKPSQNQSLRDLANVMVKIGKYKSAWSLYSGYIKENDIGEDGIDQIIKDEMIELLVKHSSILGIDTSSLELKPRNSDISLVTQWNDPTAEFEIQFVNPENRYYTWKHTKAANKELLTSEMLNGYFSNSFAIEDAGKEEWLVNAKYLGNQQNTPSYLKFTIKNNKKGSEVIKVLKLQNKDVNYRFLSLSSADFSVFN